MSRRADHPIQHHVHPHIKEESVMSDTVTVLIGTGSIGAAIARRAAVGHTLLLADYNEAQLAAVADQLQGEGYDVETRVVDVSDRASVAALADAAASLGDVVRVIHAAGVSPTQAAPERIVHVDLFGTAYVLDAFADVVAEGGSGVVIASQAGHMGQGFGAELENKLAYSPIEELVALPELADDAIDDSGSAYVIAKRANALRVQAAALAWGERGARINFHSGPRTGRRLSEYAPECCWHGCRVAHWVAHRPARAAHGLPGSAGTS